MTTSFPFIVSYELGDWELEPVLDQPHCINMSEQHKQAWLANLRSGNFDQTDCVLYDARRNAYCCLGVLEQTVCGEVESGSFPSVDWLQKHNICFIQETLPEVGGHDPQFFVLKDGERWHTSASDLNDRGVPFSVIADILEPLIKTD
jgi:hypothetical protein